MKMMCYGMQQNENDVMNSSSKEMSSISITLISYAPVIRATFFLGAAESASIDRRPPTPSDIKSAIAAIIVHKDVTRSSVNS